MGASLGFNFLGSLSYVVLEFWDCRICLSKPEFNPNAFRLRLQLQEVKPLSSFGYAWTLTLYRTSQDEELPTTDALNLTAPTRELDRKRIDEFTITSDLAHSRSFFVEGEAVLRFAQMTNWGYYESLLRFQKVLELSGMPCPLPKYLHFHC